MIVHMLFHFTSFLSFAAATLLLFTVNGSLFSVHNADEMKQSPRQSHQTHLFDRQKDSEKRVAYYYDKQQLPFSIIIKSTG